ncbi:MAG: adenylate/guanylate cyclase domain-containing protein [Pseudomonadota bacterium]
MEGLGYLKASVSTLVPVLLILPLRGYLYQKTHKGLKKLDSPKKDLYSLPWREFTADLISWLIAGCLIAGLYLVHFNSPGLTAVKIVLGCLSFGLFGGMLSYLATEKRIISLLKASGLREETPTPKRILSVSSKMLFFMVTVMLFMVLAITLMVFMDINFLLANINRIGPGIFWGVFKEILFAFTVLLFLGLIILRRFSQNLRSILDIQVEAMEQVGQGRYDTQVPVVSNDEFGLIATKTNEMIKGLRERDICQLSFGKYVTPEVSEKILRGEISPDGELSEATILFCDLRGYTPFVERQNPKDVVRFLNAYFSEMERAIRRYNGIVLQYIGDEIEAVFGAPVLEPRHPDMAVMAALEMRRRLQGLNISRSETGDEPVRHGIGIHTGMVLAGSVGSPDRLVYAMVGDAVNLASRIQSLNKQFGTDILISRDTKQALKTQEFDLVSLGKTAIRGKTEQVEIYSVR